MSVAPWIQTYTGKAFDLLDPKPEQVDVRDIAHALSLLCRFTGHCERFYSVAQHSCMVARIARDLWRAEHDAECPRPVLLRALLHDAAEAYVGDVSTPLKRAIRGEGQLSEYDVVTHRIEQVIEAALIPRAAVLVPRGIVDLNAHVQEIVKRADLIALATEHAALFDSPPRPWGAYLPPPGGYLVIAPLPATVVEHEFLCDFRNYGGAL